MTEYTVNLKLSTLQLHKLKPRIKMVLASLWIFHQMWLEILMTRLNIQINYYPLIRKFQDFNGSANTKCLKNQLTKIVQSGGFIGELIHGVG